MGRFRIAALATGFAIVAAASASAQDRSELQERYCTGDAFRLCASEIPDVERITACMTRQQNLLSPACRAVFDDAPAQAAPMARAKARKPTLLTPAPSGN